MLSQGKSLWSLVAEHLVWNQLKYSQSFQDLEQVLLEFDERIPLIKDAAQVKYMCDIVEFISNELSTVLVLSSVTCAVMWLFIVSCITNNHIYRRRSQYHDWDGTRLSLWAASCLSKDSIIEYISLKCWTFSLYRVVFYWSMTMCHPVEFVASNLFLTFQEGQICGGPRGWIPGGGAGGYLRSSSSSCKLKLVFVRMGVLMTLAVDFVTSMLNLGILTRHFEFVT